jgi:predicted AlkP superfamily pyrophosphatase or phosphodiesterase
MNRKLIIISNDALVREDMEYLKTKPCIRELINKGSFIESLKTVYPSITYCCHASMLTGAYPNKTGVYNNELDEVNNTAWTWERKHIKVKTLVDAFKEKGKTVANVFWIILTGIPMAIENATCGLTLCCTVIGIPLGLQYFKIAKLAFAPFGMEVS